MRGWIILLSGMLGLTACQALLPDAENEAEALLRKTIDYHDPKGRWDRFSAEILQTSYLERKDEVTGQKIVRERIIRLDNPASSFYMSQEVEGYPLVRRVIGSDICESTWAKDSIPEAEAEQYRLDCANARRMRNYFRYLIGLPMVLGDREAILRDTVAEVELEGNAYQVITVDYLPLGEHPTWQFYLEPETGGLRIAKFFSRHEDGTLSGEIIRLEDPVEYNGMIKFGRFVWTFLDGAPLAEEIYTFQPLDEAADLE